MTHEQKPESAEFRTREAQIETMTVHYMEAGFPINAARRLARDGVAEAEARGAADQRRKDAEGAEPFGYLVTERETGRVTFQKSPVSPQDMIEYELIVQAVYTSPANVAALEDRVKELEGVNKAWGDAAANALTWLENGRQANARDELKAAQRRAAAIREGGEHG